MIIPHVVMITVGGMIDTAGGVAEELAYRLPGEDWDSIRWIHVYPGRIEFAESISTADLGCVYEYKPVCELASREVPLPCAIGSGGAVTSSGVSSSP